MTNEKWFMITAYNSPAYYGFGTDQEAEAFCEILNADREVNVYSGEILSAEAAADLDSGKDADGFRLDLEIDARREEAEWRLSENTRHGGA